MSFSDRRWEKYMTVPNAVNPDNIVIENVPAGVANQDLDFEKQVEIPMMAINAASCDPNSATAYNQGRQGDAILPALFTR